MMLLCRGEFVDVHDECISCEGRAYPEVQALHCDGWGNRKEMRMKDNRQYS